MLFGNGATFLILSFGQFAGAEAAQKGPLTCETDCMHEPPEGSQLQVVDRYPSEFFDQYRPLNALDMVSRLPGFTVDDGRFSRGFGASGNILIDGRRPAAKQDEPADILERIPATQVQYIEIIRSGGDGIDMGSYSQLANVVLSADAAPAIVWEVALRRDLSTTEVTPEANVSLSNTWQEIDYTFGLQARESARGSTRYGRVLDTNGVVTERRDSGERTDGSDVAANFRASSWRGSTLLSLNSEFGCELEDSSRSSVRRSLTDSELRSLVFDNQEDTCNIEIGVTAERSVTPDLAAKAMLLLGGDERAEVETETEVLSPEGGNEPVLSAANDQRTFEGITRIEVTWDGWEGHSVQTNIEFALNKLHNELVRTLDTADGLSILPVPGANGNVEEWRADLLLNDTWSTGNLIVDLGVGAEFSRLSQRGDVSTDRRFAFLKPTAALTYQMGDNTQWRTRVAREISQLDFSHFVSETDLEDDLVVPGNPQLRPESRWVAEVSVHQDFADSGSIAVTGFHHWIADIEDQIPVGVSAASTGNIGDGRLWGAEVTLAWPLDSLGLSGARLDFAGRWQDSSVTDPTTLWTRVLSDEEKYDITLDFRQDLEAAKFAWGVSVNTVAERPVYKVNEIQLHKQGSDVELFIETTRWFNVKFRITLEDALNRQRTRDRWRFDGERHLSPLTGMEHRSSQGGRRIIVGISGAF